MPNVSSPLGTANSAVPLFRSDAIRQAAGLAQVYPDLASLQAAVASEAANVAGASGIWPDGQPLGIAGEVAMGVWRSWRTSVSNARRAILPSGVAVVLAGDANVVTATTGAPAAGSGASGDVALDLAAGAYYTRGASDWGASAAVFPGAAAPGDSSAPAMVSTLSAASVTHNSAVISWTAGTDNVAVTGYQYSIDGGSTYNTLGNVLTVTLSSLNPSTTYAVRVRAVDAALNTSAPLALPVTTSAAPDVTAPTLTGSVAFANIAQTTADATWPAATDSLSVTGYSISTDNGATYTPVGNVLTYALTGLTAATTYQVRVIARDAAGNFSTHISGTLTTAAVVTGNALQTHVGTLAAKQWSLLTTPAKGGINGIICTASCAGDVLTVTAAASASLGVGQYVEPSGAASPTILANTRITEQLSGTPNGVGTYRVDKSQTFASRSVSIQGKLPRTRANFDGNALWPTDADVNLNTGSNGGGVGVDIGVGDSSIRINPFSGQVLFRGGGHGHGLDGSIYGFDMFAGPKRNWKMLVPSARLKSGAEPWPAWAQQLNVLPGTLVTATGSGTAGSNQVTVSTVTNAGTGATMTASPNGAYLFCTDASAPIPVGATVTDVTGSVLTLSKPLTANMTNLPVRYTRGAYSIAESAPGYQFPPATQSYACNVFIPGSDKMALGAGGFVGGGDYSGAIGAGWVYDPAYGSNGGMRGPFQVAASATHVTPDLARYGYALSGASGGPGMPAGCDLDGKIYVIGTSYGDGQGFITLWRWDTPDTTPSVVRVANGVYTATPPNSYWILNPVIVNDPRFAGSTHRALVHDQRRLQGSANKLAIWSDITGTPQLSLIDWTPPSATWQTDAVNPAYAWNATKGVIAMSDGVDIWEFALTHNGTTYVAGALTKITTGATGDVPTVIATGGGGTNATLEYYAAGNCYILASGFDVRVIKA